VKLITREHVKIDRVAGPWLIKKFIDPNAEFHFVAADQRREHLLIKVGIAEADSLRNNVQSVAERSVGGVQN
jgi:hypothetical protein